MLDAIHVRKVGYPVRREFEELALHYIILTGNKTAALKRFKGKKGPKVIAGDICKKVLGEEGVSGWQRGRDKMFLRNGILEVLDAALKVQCCCFNPVLAVCCYHALFVILRRGD